MISLAIFQKLPPSCPVVGVFLRMVRMDYTCNTDCIAQAPVDMPIKYFTRDLNGGSGQPTGLGVVVIYIHI